MIGIYRITNTKNGKSYIGQSKNIKRRFAYHKAKLRHGYHPSTEMQSDWNKTDEKDWLFEIVQECSASELNEMENKYISEENTIEKGYNVLYSYRGNENSALSMRRVACGLSQSQLADKAGISVKALQHYEQGAKDINKAHVCTVKKLSEALGCTIMDLID